MSIFSPNICKGKFVAMLGILWLCFIISVRLNSICWTFYNARATVTWKWFSDIIWHFLYECMQTRDWPIEMDSKLKILIKESLYYGYLIPAKKSFLTRRNKNITAKFRCLLQYWVVWFMALDSTHCINKAVLCSWSNDVDHISEVLNSLIG